MPRFATLGPGPARGAGLGLGLCLLALVAPPGAPSPARRADRSVLEHAAARRPVIAAALAEIAPGTVLIAGDSHAELAGDAGLSCAPLVNAGLAGARAREVADGLSGLRRGGKARLGVLVVGTNDLLRVARPLSGEARTRFAAEAGAGLARLSAHAERVVVAAVPPLGEAAAARRDPAAVAVYSEILRALCRSDNCRFADPFAAMRAGDSGLARPGLMPDAIHLADYSAMLDALDLCPTDHRPPGSAASASGVAR
ncbi:MAG: SGNH/GDSL hydrolase family protein [Methylorubrum populi]